MKVYFTASISQRDKLMAEYKAIYETIETLGHTPITSFDIFNTPLDSVFRQNHSQLKDFYQTWLQTISTADIAIIEMSFPSTVNIGLELSQLLERGKPVICLFKPKTDPAFVGDYHSNRLIKLEYEINNIKDTLEYGFEEALKMLNRRFTFFITPEIETFLEKISQQKSISKSEYLRGLVEAEIKKQ